MPIPSPSTPTPVTVAPAAVADADSETNAEESDLVIADSLRNVKVIQVENSVAPSAEDEPENVVEPEVSSSSELEDLDEVSEDAFIDIDLDQFEDVNVEEILGELGLDLADSDEGVDSDKTETETLDLSSPLVIDETDILFGANKIEEDGLDDDEDYEDLSLPVVEVAVDPVAESTTVTTTVYNADHSGLHAGRISVKTGFETGPGQPSLETEDQVIDTGNSGTTAIDDFFDKIGVLGQRNLCQIFSFLSLPPLTTAYLSFPHRTRTGRWLF